MLVYRVCDINEYNIIMNERSIQNAGAIREINSVLNNHQYQGETRYIHFFDRLDSAIIYFGMIDRYLCVYDIDDELLAQYKGTGHYPEEDFVNHLTEYAIPSELVGFKFLKQVFLIRSIRLARQFGLEDNIGLECVYDSSSPLFRRKKRLK